MSDYETKPGAKPAQQDDGRAPAEIAEPVSLVPQTTTDGSEAATESAGAADRASSDAPPAPTLPPRARSDAIGDVAGAPAMELREPAVESSRTRAAGAPTSAMRIGVLIVNLGTPDSTSVRAVRRYLKEFLSDPRVIEEDTLTWKFVFNAIVLPFRPRSKASAYKKIWNRAANESPLKTITRGQAEKLGATLAELDERIVVDWAMRYGNPSIASRLVALVRQGCERIVLMPLYPQYSSATTATVCDEAFKVLAKMRWQPSLRVAPPYYDDPVYIEAVASSLEAELKNLSFAPDVIVASFHGMPKSYVLKGDPYYDQCVVTTQLLRERLKLDERKLLLTFQSRFGRAEWLQPYTDKTIRQLAKDGVKNVVVITPGFAADCLETLEEIGMENAHIFRRAGGANFAAVRCLNDSEAGMLVLWETAMRELKGWV
jgi:ferrochelatase